MQKLSLPLRVAAYSTSVLLSCLCFGGLLSLAPGAVPTPQPLPLLQLDQLQPEVHRIQEGTPFNGPDLWSRPHLKQPGAPAVAKPPQLRVLGLLPPDIAIIREGSRTTTVRVGESTPLGRLTAITEDGVLINGQKYKIFREEDR